ncbi:MAG: peptide chain release factor N(5)-glutamine methyltransferase [Chitinophagales bacterium]|nr:peptide chain release factor N(5)-glutamine methyltransferase [Chitinophagales bacterium]
MATDIQTRLISALAPRYGAGEARAIARIVWEDAFDFGRKPDPELLDRIEARLLQGEPVQYVLGEADFFGLKFLVNPSVLIPRQETEELVAWVLEWLKNVYETPIKLIDIGLGSGCIGITVQKKQPAIELWGIDKSEAALETARQNAACLLPGKTVHLLHADILNRLDWLKLPQASVIVSNPPYIPYTEQHLVPEHVAAHEPGMALFVEDTDPLLFYRTIAVFAREKLLPGGALFFECNEFNAQEVLQLLQDQGFSKVELRKDLAGAERMVMGELPTP